MSTGFGTSKGVSTNDRITGPTEVIPTQFSFHIWTHRLGDGSGTGARIFERNGHAFTLMNDTGSGNRYAFGDASGGSGVRYNWVRPATGVWAPIGISIDITSAANNATVYQSGEKLTVGSGVNKTGSSALIPASSTWTLGNISTGTRAWEGMLAEIAWWNVILTDAEFRMLQQGVSPDQIRPEALMHRFALDGMVGLDEVTRQRYATVGTKSYLPAPPYLRYKSPPRRLWAASASGTTHDLVGANAAQENSASAGTVSQSHALTGAASAQGNTAATGGITQTHALTGSASAQSNTASTGAVTQGAQFAADSATQTNTAGTGAITQAHSLAGTSSTHPQAASVASITQTHVLTGAGATQANTAAQGAISQGVVHDLAAAASTQANTGSAGTVTQTHVLVSAPSIQDNIAAASAIVQAHVLAALSVTQGNSASSGAITAGDNVLVSIVERTAVFQRSKSVTVRFN